jgi:hypothetical protein
LLSIIYKSVFTISLKSHSLFAELNNEFPIHFHVNVNLNKQLKFNEYFFHECIGQQTEISSNCTISFLVCLFTICLQILGTDLVRIYSSDLRLFRLRPGFVTSFFLLVVVFLAFFVICCFNTRINAFL